MEPDTTNNLQDVFKTSPADSYVNHPAVMTRRNIRIKPVFPRQSYFLFLLDYRTINKFARSTGTMDIHYFLPAHSLKKDISYYITSTLYRDIAKVADVLWQIREDGWQKLDKLEYNIILELFEFCNDYIGEVKSKLDWKLLIELYPLFLYFAQNSYYIDTIINAVDKYIDRLNPFFHDKDSIMKSLKNFLNPDSSMYSLNEIYLAYHMITYRQFFTIDDMIKIYNVDFVSGQKYHIPEHIKPQLAKFIKETASRLNKAINDKNLIDFIKSDLEIDKEKAAAQYNNLAKLYFLHESGNEKKKSILLEHANQNVKSFLSNILVNLFDYFDPIIHFPSSDVRQKPSKAGKIILPDSFLEEYKELRLCGRKIILFNSNNPELKISMTEFFNMVIHKSADNSPDSAFRIIAEDVCRISFNLAQDIFSIISQTESFNKTGNENQLKFLVQSDLANPVIINYDKEITHPVFRNKNTILENAKYLCTGLIELVYLLQHYAIKALLKDEQTIIDRIDKYQRTLERIV